MINRYDLQKIGFTKSNLDNLFHKSDARNIKYVIKKVVNARGWTVFIRHYKVEDLIAIDSRIKVLS